MDYFGINSAADLPRIKEVLADLEVEPTKINETITEMIFIADAVEEKCRNYFKSK